MRTFATRLEVTVVHVVIVHISVKVSHGKRASLMTERERLEVGNNTVEANGEFADGYCNGSLYYYDTNHQLPRPLTSEAIYALMENNLFDQRATSRWNVGFVFGWITALCENNPAFFFASIVISNSAIVTESLPVIALQEA